MDESLMAPIQEAEHSEVGGVQVDTKRAGVGRIRRLVYPVGFRWSSHVKPLVGTDLCMHAHVGFLASGTIGVRFQDGCEKTFTAPQFLIVEPGHDGWNPGTEPAVLIELDFERETRWNASACQPNIATPSGGSDWNSSGFSGAENP